MANEKQPRATAAKRTTTKSKAKADSNPPVPITDQAVSTSQPTSATARNAVIQGNGTLGLDDVRARAYELYEQRGRLEGFHEQDWYAAEQELGHNRKKEFQPQAQEDDSKKKTA
jgi:hypothetical protein